MIKPAPFHHVTTITQHRLGALIVSVESTGLDDDLKTPMAG